MKAIIAEKPSVAREIAAIVGATEKKDGYMEGAGYKVTWAFGHLIALAMPSLYGITGWKRENLPIVPPDFIITPIQKKDTKSGKYIEDPGALKQLKIIGSIFNECEKIIVATDAGREGELIFRLIYRYLKCSKPFDRLWISSLTEKAIRDGLKNLKPGQDYNNLYEAARQRSESDWLVGINASQALSISAQKGLFSLGRVQTPTLAMICKRYLENKNFIPLPFWQIKIFTEKDSIPFHAITPEQLFERENAEKIYLAVSTQKSVVVRSVNKKTIVQQPPLLYDLTSLQQDANRLYSLTADTTLSIAQKLYENKAITYPRTGSRYISDDVFEEIPALINFAAKLGNFAIYAAKLAGKELNVRCVNSSKVTDHHALLPTGTDKKDLQGNDEKVYNLIIARMLEAFSPPCIKDVTTVNINVANIDFEAKGYLIKQTGWREVQSEAEAEDEHGGQLPEINSDDILPINKAELLSKQTKSKPLFTEASLLASMESAGKDLDSEEEREAMKNSGLGTPATRAGIIETLLLRDYISRDKKNLIPTDKGLQVFDVVKEKQIADIAMTGKWEYALSKIENGELKPVVFSEKIRDYTKQITSELLNVPVQINTPSIQYKLYKCPRCGKEAVGIFKNVAKCSDCDLVVFRKIAEKMITDAQLISLIVDRQTKLIKGFTGKANKTFDASLILNNDFKVIFEFQKNT
ncbi:MAG: DNA topoisomerase III [Prolixibacteraceae bacterium]|nr:DNA topoisomerase III [Prolixibacteraceae bacterium]